MFFIDKLLFKQVKTKARVISLLSLAFFLGSPILEGNILNAEVIFMFFNCFALFLLWKKKSYLLVGLLGFLSLVTKVPGFVEFAVICATILTIYFREKGLKFTSEKAVLIVAGFVSPLILTIIYFYLRGTLPDFIYANATFNRIYSLHQGNYMNLLGSRVPATYLSALSLFSIIFFSTLLFWKKKWTGFTFLVVNLFAVEGFSSLLSGKNYSHYFLQVLPSLAMLLAILINNFGNKVKKINLIYSAILFACFIPMLLVFKNGGSLPVYARPQEYYPWFLFDQDKFWWRNNKSIIRIKNFSQLINSQYLEYSPAYIYTDKPWVEALINRELTNKYVVWFHLQYREEHLNEELANNVSRAKLFALDLDPPTIEKVREVLDTEFTKVGTFENFEIYIRK